MAAQKLVSLTLMNITRGRKPGLKWAQLRACNGAPSKALELDRFLLPSVYFSRPVGQRISPRVLLAKYTN